MKNISVIFQKIGFTYESMSSPLIEGLSLQFERGWTGIVGANGVGKSTILKIATGVLEIDKGVVHLPQDLIYCPQRTDQSPDLFETFIHSEQKEAFLLKKKLQIDDDWLGRWDSLSHGERKRVQIGVALWQQPKVLAIDEPSNHLDRRASDFLLSALSSFKGVGLLVSHDKSFLDTLCQHCLFIDPPDFTLRPGNFSQGWQQTLRESKTKEKQYLHSKKEAKRLDREVKKRRAEAAKADRKRSKRGIDKKDHDAKAKIDAARLSGKDAVAGKLMNQLSGRKSQIESRLAEIHVKKTYETGIWQEGEKSRKKTLFSFDKGSISLGKQKTLFFPRLEMKPDDRIAITGLNGTGKSSLIRFLVNQLSMPSDQLLYIPQEIPLSLSKKILANVNQLSGEKRGNVMTIVSRLGTRPPGLLETDEPSPGEIRKVMLAMGVASKPYLIIMDEPTNHLDLVSIECLREALEGFPAGLLLVSHDQAFLDAVCSIQWQLSPQGSDQNQIVLNVS